MFIKNVKILGVKNYWPLRKCTGAAILRAWQESGRYSDQKGADRLYLPMILVPYWEFVYSIRAAR